MHLSVVPFVQQALLPQELADRIIHSVSKPTYQAFIRAICDRNDTDFEEIGVEGSPSIEVDFMKWPSGPECAADVVIACETLQYAVDGHDFLTKLCAMTRETLILTTRSGQCPSGGEGDAWRYDIDDLIRGCAACGMIAVVSQPDMHTPGVLLKAVRPGFVSLMRTPAPVEESSSETT